MKEILEILNPVRVMKVEDFRLFAIKLINTDTIKYHITELQSIQLNLIKRYESLTSLPLTKSMFVCEMEKPKEPPLINETAARYNYFLYGKKKKEYTEAQSKVWFEGFEKYRDLSVKDENHFGLTFYGNGEIMLWCNKTQFRSIKGLTVHYFITEIDRYNRTATEPIKLNFTENFVMKLLK